MAHRSNAQVQQLFKALHEAGEIRDRSQRAIHLLTETLRAFDCHMGVASTISDFDPGGSGRLMTYLSAAPGSSSAEARALLEPCLKQGIAVDPTVAKIMEAISGQPASCAAVFRRQDLVSDGDWYRSAFVAEVFRPNRTDHAIYGVLPCEMQGVLHGIAFFRPWGARPFTDEEASLLEMFYAQCYRTLDPSRFTLGARPRLPPRVEETLEWLLKGYSEKEIAHELMISPHTVHQYVKSIYRAFDVKSRAELLISGVVGTGAAALPQDVPVIAGSES